MSKCLIRVSIPIASLLCVGCIGDKLLFFGQSHTVGITIAGSTTDQRAELSLGYRDYDIAIVPVKALSEVPDEKGNVHRDSLSVLGQFEVGTEAKTAGLGADLGKFFATGSAAKTLADGFRCQLADGKHESCYEKK